MKPEFPASLAGLVAAMHDGRLYNAENPELTAIQRQKVAKVNEYNATAPGEGERRTALLREIFWEAGEGCYIEPPFHANWGCHTHLGKNVYANFNLTLTDDTHIYIGDSVLIGPNVTLVTAAHPEDPEPRALCFQYNRPVRLERGVWLGAGVIVLPGVTIGENSIIGAGSVVTRDIPPNVVAYGVPCRVQRPLRPADRDWRKKAYLAPEEEGKL